MLVVFISLFCAGGSALAQDDDAIRPYSGNPSYWQYKGRPVLLGCFRFGLRIAQRWRERLGMPRDSRYDYVLEHLSPIPVRDGVYIIWESVSRDSGLWDTSVDPWGNPKWLSDHPSLAGLYGMIPGDGMDLETMQRTYDRVLQTWPRYKWGWDYGMMAMAAARLGRPETERQFPATP